MIYQNSVIVPDSIHEHDANVDAQQMHTSNRHALLIGAKPVACMHLLCIYICIMLMYQIWDYYTILEWLSYLLQMQPQNCVRFGCSLAGVAVSLAGVSCLVHRILCGKHIEQGGGPGARCPSSYPHHHGHQPRPVCAHGPGCFCHEDPAQAHPVCGDLPRLHSVPGKLFWHTLGM